MARIFTALEVILALFVLDNCISDLEGISLRVDMHTKMEALQERKCMNLVFAEPCIDTPHCNVTVRVKLTRGTKYSQSAVTWTYKKVPKLNGSYVLCLYDERENVSCCNDINGNPAVSIASGHRVSFRNYDEINLNVRACINASSSPCLTLINFFKAVLPWSDPCFFDKPCQNSGTCKPAVNSYNCSCRGDWKGENCTVLDGMTRHVGRCLNYSSNADFRRYERTAEGCKTTCKYMGASRCKAFEFTKTPSSNLGNCTLRESNSLDYQVVSCDMDLYEFTSLLTPTIPNSNPSPRNAPTVLIVASQVLLMSFATFFL